MSWVDEEKLLNYRINMKNRLGEMLEKHDKVAMQEPTGIGKSYMMIEICKEKEGNKIIFEPTRVLADKFEDEIRGTNTKTMIYQNLIGLSDIDLENMFKNTNYLFLDEVHRIGAEQWGKQIKKVFKMFPEMKIIGLTATPIRTDKINVFTEFFDNVQTEPMDLLTAINEHLLPQITYVTAYASILKEVESRREAIQQSKLLFSETKHEYLRVLETYRHKLESIMNIPKILKKYIKLEKINDKNFKVLLFVSRLNQINEAEKETLKWFNKAFPEKKINIYKLENVGRKINKKEVENFENNENINEIDIMISVNKLIEGFHIKRVSSAIFLRRTCSNIVFLQQIGRTLSESEPIIFDFVENHKSVGNGLEIDFDKFRKNIKNYSATKKDDKIDKPIIWLNDELLETEEIFNKIGTNNYSLLDKNLDKINELIKEGKETNEIANYFTISPNIMYNYLIKNNLETESIKLHRIVTSEDFVNELKSYDGCDLTGKEILEKINRKFGIELSVGSINNRFRRLGIGYKKLSSSDRIITEEIEKEILNLHNCGIPTSRISEKLREKGIDIKDSTVKGYFHRNSIEFNKVPREQIRIRAGKDNNKYIEVTKNNDVKRYLEENIGRTTIKEMMEHLGIKTRSVFLRTCECNNVKYVSCIQRNGQSKHAKISEKAIVENQKLFEENKDEILDLLRNGMPLNKISQKTGIDSRYLKIVCKENDIKINGNKRNFTGNIINYLKENAMNKSLSELEKEIGIPRKTIGRWFKRNNIHYMNEK